MGGLGCGQISDEDAERQILATVLIPPDYYFSCFAIADEYQRVISIHWRDIETHMDKPIYVVLRSKEPVQDEVFAWKLLECKVVPLTVN